ncbi:MAG: hypothetical protein ACREUG_11985 [Steroidobacteraceae bacterium]
MTWRAVLTSQALGLLFALYSWLERWHRPGQPSLLLSIAEQATAALLVMLAAFAADEAIRRGWGVWGAFVAVLLCSSTLYVLFLATLHAAFGASHPIRGVAGVLNDFMAIGSLWGTVLMVYLNRQSAQRLLARLRTDELERVQAEHGLIASRLAATAAQIDPAAVLLQLATVRDLFAAGNPEADERLDGVIIGLRGSREAAVHGAAPRPDDHSP